MGEDSLQDENLRINILPALENPGNHGIMEPSRVAKTSELKSDAAKVTNPQVPHPTGSSRSRDRRREQQKRECPSIPIGSMGG